MIKVGILGAGFMGSTHAKGYGKLPDVEMAGIFSRSAERAAKVAQEVGAKKGVTDMDGLVQDPDIDVIDICIPTPWHKEYTIKALEAGKHVLCEKPMAMTATDCEAMIEAAEKSGKVLMVAHVLRFWPEYVALKELVASGKLGKTIAATASRLSTRPTWGEWFSHADQTGGAVFDLQIHDLDTFNWLFGRPRSVYALGGKGEPGGWDHVLTLVHYDSSQGFAEGSVMMPPEYPFTMTLSVRCERGSVEYTFRAGGVSVEMGVSGARLTVYEPGKEPYSPPFEEGDAYDNEVAYFIECVRAGKQPQTATAQEGLLAVRTARAAWESMDTDKVVIM